VLAPHNHNARALAAHLPRQDHVCINNDELFVFLKNNSTKGFSRREFKFVYVMKCKIGKRVESETILVWEVTTFPDKKEPNKRSSPRNSLSFFLSSALPVTCQTESGARQFLGPGSYIWTQRDKGGKHNLSIGWYTLVDFNAVAHLCTQLRKCLMRS